MKRVIFVFVALLCCTTLSAQGIEKMRSKLAQRTAEGAMVQVSEDAVSSEAIRAVDNAVKPSKVSGYRVVIHFDNAQGASDRSRAVLSTFRSKYPHINAYLVYESPYFKVFVGDCLTMEEALILMHSISGDYPKAFPKREDIPLAALQSVKREEPAEVVAPEPQTTAGSETAEMK